jgi:hypothetical protein
MVLVFDVWSNLEAEPRSGPQPCVLRATLCHGNVMRGALMYQGGRVEEWPLALCHGDVFPSPSGCRTMADRPKICIGTG